MKEWKKAEKVNNWYDFVKASGSDKFLTKTGKMIVYESVRKARFRGRGYFERHNY